MTRFRPAPWTAARLREIIFYDPGTGQLTWVEREARTPHDRQWNTRFAGREAGYISNGYRVVCIGRAMNWRAHRLAWYWMTGEWPCDGDIDHANLNRADNRWANLRRATRAQNVANGPVRSDNTSGLKGVSWRKDVRRWRAQIHVNGRGRSLGNFDSCEEAYSAYVAEARRVFGEFARV